jgi:hypothetical protein
MTGWLFALMDIPDINLHTLRLFGVNKDNMVVFFEHTHCDELIRHSSRIDTKAVTFYHYFSVVFEQLECYMQVQQ